ncbi:peptidyl-tRNA hydrolase [Mycotypha africana]|uniref:peptidyl-tRNA hydrolase n=1 Tax=Mycotypha africana TaxID=64632 RepID=UPI0022FFEDA9|nr:peptidyl-tRNA hydrolase [Mycotypha africana]KAI8987704.1 peptidyl-tRNA hydrolase [Mycotypha africana]
MNLRANCKSKLVGLGNKTLPGTRHNVGMMTVDAIAKHLNLSWTQRRGWKSDITDTVITVPTKDNVTQEYHITLLKPRKLMNISGSCVAQAALELGVSLNNLYVFHDDMQRDLGKVQLKYDAFKRVRIGIGRPPPEIDDRSYEVVAAFVLGKFTAEEIEKLEKEVYPMWTKNQGLELLCQSELIKKPKKKNKNKTVDPNKWEKKNKPSRINNVDTVSNNGTIQTESRSMKKQIATDPIIQSS